jgi:acetylornithine deacetylase/succinyl-diaminopimelate desuccinylase-like protein
MKWFRSAGAGPAWRIVHAEYDRQRDAHDPLPLLCDPAAANSINPALVGGECRRDRRARLAAAGLDVGPMSRRGRMSGVPRAARQPDIMFCGHLDTVGVDGMVDPVAPRAQRRAWTGIVD